MPFLTYDPFPQCLQQSPLAPLLLARVTSEEVGAIYQTLSVSPSETGAGAHVAAARPGLGGAVRVGCLGRGGRGLADHRRLPRLPLARLSRVSAWLCLARPRRVPAVGLPHPLGDGEPDQGEGHVVLGVPAGERL